MKKNFKFYILFGLIALLSILIYLTKFSDIQVEQDSILAQASSYTEKPSDNECLRWNGSYWDNTLCKSATSTIGNVINSNPKATVGQCSKDTVNGCVAGLFKDVIDTAIDYKWSCQGTKTRSDCSLKKIPYCAVIAFGGINSDGSFVDYSENWVKRFKASKPGSRVVMYGKSYDVATRAASAAQATIDVIKRDAERNKEIPKILLLAHSISSIGVFNAGIVADKVVLYDPPYNSSAASYMPKFIANMFKGTNPSQIFQAKKAGIATHPNTIDMSDGYDGKQNTNSTKTDEELHNDFSKLDSIIYTWLDTNCKPY